MVEFQLLSRVVARHLAKSGIMRLFSVARLGLERLVRPSYQGQEPVTMCLLEV
jgi:hypothetical protein